MSEELTRFIAARLEQLHLQKKELAHRVGKDPSEVSKVLKGERLPPMDDPGFSLWTRALGLERAERDQFRELVHLAHASPLVRKLVERLRQAARRP